MCVPVRACVCVFVCVVLETLVPSAMVHSGSEVPLVGGQFCQGPSLLLLSPWTRPSFFGLFSRTYRVEGTAHVASPACLAEEVRDPVPLNQERYLGEWQVGGEKRGFF